MSAPKVAGIIPARYDSSRLPGKPLKMIGALSMIERVYKRCMEADLLDFVVVATDDTRIVDAVEAFGGQAVMTKVDHLSGTDRLAEAAEAATRVHRNAAKQPRKSTPTLSSISRATSLSSTPS